MALFLVFGKDLDDMLTWGGGAIPEVLDGGLWGGAGKLKLVFNGEVIWLDDTLSGLDWRLVDGLILPFSISDVSVKTTGVHYVSTFKTM